MEEYPKVMKRDSDKFPISIQLFESYTEQCIDREQAELLCERLRAVLEHQRMQVSDAEILAFSGTVDEKVDVEINEIDDADHFGQVHDRITRLSKILDRRTGEINVADEIEKIVDRLDINAGDIHDVAGRVGLIDKRMDDYNERMNHSDVKSSELLSDMIEFNKRQKRLEESSEDAIGTMWRNMTALEKKFDAPTDGACTRCGNYNGACTAAECLPVARACGNCGLNYSGLCISLECSRHSQWKATPNSARKDLGNPPLPGPAKAKPVYVTVRFDGSLMDEMREDIAVGKRVELCGWAVTVERVSDTLDSPDADTGCGGACSVGKCGMCGMCIHRNHCEPYSVFERVISYDGCRNNDCGECRNSGENGGVCENGQVFERVGDTDGRRCIIYKHEHDDDECDSYIGIRSCNVIPWYSHIEDARKFANAGDAAAYARELGIVDDVSFRFVDGEGDEIEVGDLVSRGGSDRWVVTISLPGLRFIRLLCVCAGSDALSSWSVSDQSAVSRGNVSLIAKAGQWGS